VQSLRDKKKVQQLIIQPHSVAPLEYKWKSKKGGGGEVKMSRNK
jgi:hypothetical protein